MENKENIVFTDGIGLKVMKNCGITTSYKNICLNIPRCIRHTEQSLVWAVARQDVVLLWGMCVTVKCRMEQLDLACTGSLACQHTYSVNTSYRLDLVADNTDGR